MESNRIIPRTSIISVPIFFLLILFSSATQAQTWNEFFRQKKTQIRYLGEQIAALRIYAGYLKDGYEIVGDGVQTVKSLKNSEFTLHDAFFKSLKAVNPSIGSGAKVADIIALQVAINKRFKGINTLDYLSTGQQNYITAVKNEVLKECDNDLKELLLVVTSGQLEMGDDERLKRIDKIYAAMEDKSSFAQSFCNELSMLDYQKRKEEQSIIHIRNLYEND